MTNTGAELRRTRQVAGISLSAMAARTHYSKSYLGNVETGRRAATADVVLAYEQALGGDVDRRSLLTGVAAATVAPAAISELIHRGFAAALDDSVSDDDWLARVDTYGRDYMSMGAEELQTRLAKDLVLLQRRLGSPARWDAAARLMTVYGKTLSTTDRRQGSVRWYQLAASAADRSGRADVQSWVRGRAALALAYEGAALSTASDLAERAMATPGGASVGRLNALMATALIAAIAGDGATASRRLDDAQRVFEAAGSSDQISDFAVPEWRMATFTSMLLSRLGDRRAVAAQEAADRTRPPELVRFATHIELHRGLMMAKTGDVAGGVDHAKRAMDRLPTGRHSTSLRLMVTEIERMAPERRAGW